MERLGDVPPSSGGKRRGFALLFVLAFAACVVTFTAVIGSQAAYNMHLSTNRGETDRAYYAANTGTQLILSCMREPPSDRDFDNDGVDGTWLGEDCSVFWPMPSSNSMVFAHVYHNIPGFPHAQTAAPDGTSIATDHFYVISIGAVNAVLDPSGNLVGGVRYEQATMGATLQPSFPMLPQAAFSYDHLTVNGTVDYFDSQAPAPWTASTDGTKPEASVGTDKLTAADVTIDTSTAKVLGNVLLGFEAPDSEVQTLATSLSAVATTPPAPLPNQYAQPGADGSGNPAQAVTGHVSSMSAPKSVFNMGVDASKLEAVYPPGHVYTTALKEGKIYLQQQDLNVGSGSTISIDDTNADGKVEDVLLIVQGDVTFTGTTNQVNGNSAPRHLKIYSLDSDGDGTVFSMTNSQAFCLVAGTNMDVNINAGSELWGAVLGKNVTLEAGGQIHYDVRLRDPNIIADVYGFTIGSSTIVAGAALPVGGMGPVGTGGSTGTSGTGTSGTGTSGTGTSGTVGCGCGCGCGCGSMLMMAKK
jgi:hypothetical protein